MIIDAGKSKQIFSEIATNMVSASKTTVQKAIKTNPVSTTIEKLPVPSSSQVLTYQTGVCRKTEMAKKAVKNCEYVFERPVADGKKEVTKIIKTSQGIFIDKGIVKEDYIYSITDNYKKLHNFPNNYTAEELIKFMEKGDFKTSAAFEHSPEKFGHSVFNLPQGSNSYRKVNDTVISQLYSSKSKKPQRITVHYTNNRVSTNDFDLKLSTILEPNTSNNGMRIRKSLGSEKIDLTSCVEKDIVTITDNLTGKQFSFNILEILGENSSYIKEIEIPLEQRKEEIIKLFKTLSPTTILNLLKFMRTQKRAYLPFIKDFGEAYQKIEIITLSKSPQTTSHEAFHGITEILNLSENSELKKLHSKEARKNKGLISVLSSYAERGSYFDNEERGLHELISIMGTMNEYGRELSYRAEATRLAFPETTKAIEKKLMEHYKKTIKEFFV